MKRARLSLQRLRLQGSGTVRRFATTVNKPTAFEASVRVMVAEVPFPLMFTLETVMSAGVNAGKKENVAPVRLEPFTVKLTVGVLSTGVGLIEVMTGTASTVKLPLDVAVEVPTVTLMGPVVAPAGTVVVKLFVVAAVTVAVVPLNFTVLALGVALKFWAGGASFPSELSFRSSMHGVRIPLSYFTPE